MESVDLDVLQVAQPATLIDQVAHYILNIVCFSFCIDIILWYVSPPPSPSSQISQDLTLGKLLSSCLL